MYRHQDLQVIPEAVLDMQVSHTCPTKEVQKLLGINIGYLEYKGPEASTVYQYSNNTEFEK